MEMIYFSLLARVPTPYRDSTVSQHMGSRAISGVYLSQYLLAAVQPPEAYSPGTDLQKLSFLVLCRAIMCIHNLLF